MIVHSGAGLSHTCLWMRSVCKLIVFAQSGHCLEPTRQLKTTHKMVARSWPMAHGVNSECALAASTPNRRRYLVFLDLEKERKN